MIKSTGQRLATLKNSGVEGWPKLAVERFFLGEWSRRRRLASQGHFIHRGLNKREKLLGVEAFDQRYRDKEPAIGRLLRATFSPGGGA